MGHRTNAARIETEYRYSIQCNATDLGTIYKRGGRI